MNKYSLAALGVAVQALPALSTVLLFPRATGPAAYAEWSVFGATVSTFVLTFFEHVRLSAMRMTGDDEDQQSKVLGVSFALSAAACVVVSLLGSIRSGDLGALLAGACATSQALLDCIATLLRVRADERRFLAQSSIRSCLTLTSCVAFFALHSGPPSLLEMALTFYGPNLLVATGYLALLVRARQRELGTVQFCAARGVAGSIVTNLRFSAPIIVANSAYALGLLGFRKLAQHAISGGPQFLLLSDLMQRTMVFCGGLVATISLPYLMRASMSPERQNERSLLSLTAFALSLIIAPVLAGSIAVHQELLEVLSGWNSGALRDRTVALLVASYATYTLIQFWAHGWFLARKRTMALVAAAILPYVAQAILSNRPIGIDGIAEVQFATMVGSILVLLALSKFRLLSGLTAVGSVPAAFGGLAVYATASVVKGSYNLSPGPQLAAIVACAAMVYGAILLGLWVSRARLSRRRQAASIADRILDA